MSKYHAKATKVDGVRFASQAEAARYKELKMLENAGHITELVLQPRYLLQETYVHPREGRVRGVTYVADFAYFEHGQLVVEDVKGQETPVFKLKAKLFKKRYPYIDFRLIPAKDYSRR